MNDANMMRNSSHLSSDIREILQMPPPHVMQHVSMMSADEKILCYSLAKSCAPFTGRIVDLGLFVGASTSAFCQGILDNPLGSTKHTKKPVFALDLGGKLQPYERYFKDPQAKAQLDSLGVSLEDDFFTVIKAYLKHYPDIYELVEADLRTLQHFEDPIEIAFYDCLKQPDVNHKAFQLFWPRYIPGKTMVVQQDYFYPFTYWIMLYQEYYSDYFSFHGQFATSGLFRLEKPLPAEAYTRDLMAELPMQQQFDLIQQAAARCGNLAFQYMCYLAIPVVRASKQDYAQALRDLDSITEQFTRRHPDFKNNPAIQRYYKEAAEHIRLKREENPGEQQLRQHVIHAIRQLSMAQRRYQKGTGHAPLFMYGENQDIQLTEDSLKDAVLLPTREAMIGKMIKGGIVAELGTYKGDFACKILKICQPEKLYSIDMDHQFINYDQFDAGDLKDKRVEFVKSISWEALSQFPDDHFDFIYIDAGHLYRDIAQDIDIARVKVKPGGFLLFDDYTHWTVMSSFTYGVKRAVTEFILKEGWPVKYFAFKPPGDYHNIGLQRPEK